LIEGYGLAFTESRWIMKAFSARRAKRHVSAGDKHNFP
jgi:hypothetical protein